MVEHEEPYGFKCDGGKRVQDADELETVHLIYDEWRARRVFANDDDQALRVIAAHLNRNEVARRGRIKRWTAEAVRQILSNSLYKSITPSETSDLQEG